MARFDVPKHTPFTLDLSQDAGNPALLWLSGAKKDRGKLVSIFNATLKPPRRGSIRHGFGPYPSLTFWQIAALTKDSGEWRHMRFVQETRRNKRITFSFDDAEDAVPGRDYNDLIATITFQTAPRWYQPTDTIVSRALVSRGSVPARR